MLQRHMAVMAMVRGVNVGRFMIVAVRRDAIAGAVHVCVSRIKANAPWPLRARLWIECGCGGQNQRQTDNGRERNENGVAKRLHRRAKCKA